jgi:hypothetical protein
LPGSHSRRRTEAIDPKCNALRYKIKGEKCGKER